MATLDVVEDGLLENARTIGDRLMAGMRGLAERHASIGDVRGAGLMIGVELVKDRETREPAGELAHELVQRAFQRGLLLLGAGKSALRLRSEERRVGGGGGGRGAMGDGKEKE